MHKNTTLLILAAGMGSRYGGLKQLDEMGPNGETIIDYSIVDAIQADFERVIFIVREEFAEEFHEKVAVKYDEAIDMDYVYQGLESEIPEGLSFPDRQKPWGTAHAVLCARDQINGPFAVINADDFYGREAFLKAANYLRTLDDEHKSGMIGYLLENTLSEHGTVNRGICRVDENNRLVSVTERLNIGYAPHGGIQCSDPNYTGPLAEGTIVSMNFWLFHPTIFQEIKPAFHRFLKERGQEEKSELYIPDVVDLLIKGGQMNTEVIPTHATWFGVTYQDDKEKVSRALHELHEAGTYPGKVRASN